MGTTDEVRLFNELDGERQLDRGMLEPCSCGCRGPGAEAVRQGLEDIFEEGKGALDENYPFDLRQDLCIYPPDINRIADRVEEDYELTRPGAASLKSGPATETSAIYRHMRDERTDDRYGESVGSANRWFSEGVQMGAAHRQAAEKLVKHQLDERKLAEQLYWAVADNHWDEFRTQDNDRLAFMVGLYTGVYRGDRLKERAKENSHRFSHQGWDYQKETIDTENDEGSGKIFGLF
ncbi:MAG: hypothetical protein ABEK01_00975 [Candidatus Nanohaloarchaea archaeon]